MMLASPTVRCDFLIIGAGVVGLAMAREIKIRNPGSSVVLLEKEARPGQHASGRNSGVLHSGIYYPAASLKARVCAAGAQELSEYCVERKLPLKRLGKILVPALARDAAQLDLLEDRGRKQGLEVIRLDRQQLSQLEPHVRSATGQALLVPSTAVVSSSAVIDSLATEVTASGVSLQTNAVICEIDVEKRILRTTQSQFAFGHVINCSGAYADRVAHLFGAAKHYAIIPFRGTYWKLDPGSDIQLRHLVYPVPDMRVPFLGVHTTTTVDGEVYLGPTATPALGRESYVGLSNLGIGEAARIGARLSGLFIGGSDGFRHLALREAWRATEWGFLSEVRRLLPLVRREHLRVAPHKTGIRPQMLDLRTGRLEMDFRIEQSPGATHILNAISPAFTSAFPLARHIVNEYIEKA